MPTPADKDLSPRLRGLLPDVASSITEAIRSMIDRKVESTAGEILRSPVDEIASGLPTPSVLVRGTPAIRFVVDIPTALTLAACMRMDSTQAMEEIRAKGAISKEDLEAFNDIATGICSGTDSAVRNVVENPGELRLEDCRAIEAASEWSGQLGQGRLVWYRFPITIEGCPEAAMHVVLDPETANVWNGEPLDTPEEIPLAPIRGKLCAYLVNKEVLEVVKKTCRRVGLELERHPSTAIPNPAAHRDEIVLMDVTPAESRRFGWCKRMKKHSGDIKTVLVIHHPSRPRIIEAFRAKADVIVGWPATEEQLSEKLTAMLDEPVEA